MWEAAPLSPVSPRTLHAYQTRGRVTFPVWHRGSRSPRTSLTQREPREQSGCCCWQFTLHHRVGPVTTPATPISLPVPRRNRFGPKGCLILRSEAQTRDEAVYRPILHHPRNNSGNRGCEGSRTPTGSFRESCSAVELHTPIFMLMTECPLFLEILGREPPLRHRS